MDGAPADTFTAIEYAVADRVGRITLARPEAGNALSMRLRLDLVRALRLAESDPDVTVVVIDAQGDAFCAGYDLKEPYGSKAERAERGNWVSDPALAGWTDQFARSCLQDWMTAWDLLKPVVAIVQGYCLAGGTELMSFADIVFAADDARIGYPPMRAMSTPDVPIMPWKMTMARAKYLQLTGNSITGRDGRPVGLGGEELPRRGTAGAGLGRDPGAVAHRRRAAGREQAAGQPGLRDDGHAHPPRAGVGLALPVRDRRGRTAAPSSTT